MTASPSTAGATPHDRLVRALDYNRGSIGPSCRGPNFKEWLHFCVYGDGVDLLANFSAVDHVMALGKHRSHRMTTLFREHVWRGDIETFAAEACHAAGGSVGMRFGRNEVVFRNGCYHLHVAPSDGSMEAHLRLRPVTIPAALHNVTVSNGPPINWAVIPRLHASGTIRIDDTLHVLQDAPAYHDHNWGAFRWGHDFAWEWGYCLPRERTNPWSAVAVRLSNRSHTTSLAQALMLWKGERQHRIFRAHELEIWQEGLLRPRSVLKLPAVMALIRPGTSTDIPRRFFMRGRADGDELTCAFEANDVAQVIIPNDDIAGVTIINEVQGTFTLDGRVRGESIEFEGGGVFEFLGD